MVKNNFLFFWGGTYSQWCPSEFEIDGVYYNCAEQYMMAKKALLFNDLESYDKIMLEKQPYHQKALGKKVKGFVKETWESVCRTIVFDANYAKFTQNPKMYDELMATGNLEIVEASPEDTIWGIGLLETDPLALNKATWKGTNWLGEAIMGVRDELRKELE